jgi:hypothetical protein
MTEPFDPYLDLGSQTRRHEESLPDPELHEPGAILASIQECPECGAAVATHLGEDLDGCAQHTRRQR